MSDLMASIIVFIGCSLSGWIFVCVAIYTERYQRKKEATERALASGKIVDSVQKVNTAGRRRPTTYYVPVIEFEANGQVYRLENENGVRHVEEIEIGKSVDVMYDPNEPAHFHITTDDANEKTSASIMRIGVIIIIGAAVLAIVNYYYHLF